MNDRELLERAARAYGLGEEWSFHAEFGAMARVEAGVAVFDEDIWNSLADDGDALRLAVKVGIIVSTGPCEATASTIGGSLRGFVAKETTITQPSDVAVRRAITRAAAESLQ